MYNYPLSLLTIYLLHMNFILKKATFPKQFNLFYISYSIQTFLKSLLLNIALFFLTIQK